MKAFWNERYQQEEYAYGTAPNAFFKQALDNLNIQGDILLVAEGEGRNAVHAAKQGLEVIAFDISLEGKRKADELAARENVSINYVVGDFAELEIAKATYEVAAFIYAHLPPDKLVTLHRKIASLIKPNGYILLEGFSKNNLKYRAQNPRIGGPPNAEMLFSVEQIREDFPAFEIIQLEEVETELHEGLYHNGKGSVVRFIGKKTH